MIVTVPAILQHSVLDRYFRRNCLDVDDDDDDEEKSFCCGNQVIL